MASIVIGVTYYISTSGYSYYILPLEERFYHPNYDWFKPSGLFGQGLGVIGTFLIAFGVTIYIVRKRYGFMERFIRLKYLLEFHIFLCTLGPILILFHTTFKFGGIVSIAFWSMVAVVLSGVVGRFIYIQIPRSIEGRALNIQEIQKKRLDFSERIKSYSSIKEETIELILSSNTQEKWGLNTYFKNKKRLHKIKQGIQNSGLNSKDIKSIIEMTSEEMSLASKVGRLNQMQKLFKYWHVVHMPFAIIMLVIVVIHVGVSISLGYKWIF
jgi:hypothetical protein